MIGQTKKVLIKIMSSNKRKLSSELSESDIKTLKFQMQRVRKYNEAEKVLSRCKEKKKKKI